MVKWVALVVWYLLGLFLPVWPLREVRRVSYLARLR